jgi:hypothetical protein
MERGVGRHRCRLAPPSQHYCRPPPVLWSPGVVATWASLQVGLLLEMMCALSWGLFLFNPSVAFVGKHKDLDVAPPFPACLADGGSWATSTAYACCPPALTNPCPSGFTVVPRASGRGGGAWLCGHQSSCSESVVLRARGDASYPHDSGLPCNESITLGVRGGLGFRMVCPSVSFVDSVLLG